MRATAWSTAWARAAQLAENESDDQRAAADAERDNADARNWNRDQSEQDAEHHADPERDITKFRGGLYRVAEMLADFLFAVGRHQHANTIAEFEHQVGRRHEVGVIASHM